MAVVSATRLDVLHLEAAAESTSSFQRRRDRTVPELREEVGNKDFHMPHY